MIQPTFVTLFASAVLRHADAMSLIDRNGFVQVALYKTGKDGKIEEIARDTLLCNEFALVLHDARNSVEGAAAVGWTVKPMRHSIYAEQRKGISGRIFEARTQSAA